MPLKSKRTKTLEKRPAASVPESAEGEVPRAPQQDRGQKRVEEILDAAELVVAEVGWEAASTQAIADRAGASMGSLYHFFPTKDALLVALARRYKELMFTANERAMPMEVVWIDPEALFDRVIRAQAEVAESLPGFTPVCAAIARKFGYDAGPMRELDEAIHEHVRAFCSVRTPRLPSDQREATVRLMVGVVHRTMQDAGPLPPAQRQALFRAARDMLAGFLRDLDARYGPAQGKD